MDQFNVARHWEANAEAWTRFSRAGHDVYRDVLNTPAFLEMLPSISGLRGLDICCGEGSNTRRLAELGAQMDAIDFAPTFIRHAQQQEDSDALRIRYLVGDALDLPYADGTFDFATSFMAMMDVADPQRAVAEASRILCDGGFFQFSILHPCFVPPKRRNIRDADGNPIAVEVADYFENVDGQVESWLFSSIPPDQRKDVAPFRIPRFHRTLSQWVDIIGASGLVLEKLGEPRADQQTAAAEPIVADTRIAPIFLHFRARKI